ncbi:DUF6542 domain-containing protein [Streptomyces sp. UG1]|uniref:DUF6542 domain-containing protein n=1 Tax=Streptomyces sp. UG1 TaxID=3417652 RepID=UPI003CED7B41
MPEAGAGSGRSSRAPEAGAGSGRSSRVPEAGAGPGRPSGVPEAGAGPGRPSRAPAQPTRSTRPVSQRRPSAEQAAAAVRLPGSPPHAPQALRRFPDPRLTGLGSGLFCGAVMLLLGYLDSLLFGSLTLYGVLFLPVCALTAVWVREGDLLTAPVVVPIAFAVGLVPLADGGGGIGGRLMGLVTALATEAGWLYGGTLIAGLVVIVRRVRLVARRVAARRRPS